LSGWKIFIMFPFRCAATACCACVCFSGTSTGSSAPGKIGTRFPAIWQSALAIIARFAASPVTVVMPSSSHWGLARNKKANGVINVMPMSVSKEFC
jgi:hypothetical protein